MLTFNHEVAAKLRDIGTLLVSQHADPFRSRAFFNAADTLDVLTDDVRQIVQDKGIKGLIDLPAIGTGIARSIYEYVAMGRMTRLENLQGKSDPVSLFQTIPTVGREMAERIYHSLHVDSFESLENATRNGQLDKVKGLGSKRKQAIEAWLIKHFDEQKRSFRPAHHPVSQPDVKLLLNIDAEYRRKASEGKLPLITPKRFNPDNKAWLPVLHSTHKPWHFTALYSNTARAQKLNRVFDWVVIYFYDDQHQEGQNTVVTETRGSLVGKRVIRGREAECHAFYETETI